jgi:hypothetical protein
MTGPERFQAALAGLHLPIEWQMDVAIRPRRRSIGIKGQARRRCGGADPGDGRP